MNIHSKYKIIHTTCHTLWGGLEKRIYNESVWMDKNGHKVIIVAPKDTPLFQKAKAYGFRVYGLEFKRLGFIKDYRFLRQLFKNEKPDIVNTHGNADSKIVLPAAYRAKVPCRILSRHISVHVRNSFFNRLLYKKYSHYVFTTSDYATDHLKKVFKIKNTQIFTISSGTRPPENLPDKDDARKSVLDELGLAPETRLIGFIGRLSEDKGISLTLKAFKLIQDRIKDLHFVIVGQGLDTYIESMKQLAAELGIEKKVHFIGFRENVWNYYPSFDCSLLASQNIGGVPFEGVPQSVLESMFCSCPVVGAQSGGVPDVVKHKKTGLLFDGTNPDDLADKVIETITDKSGTIQRVNAANAMVNTDHTIDAMGRNILRIYRLHQVKIDNNTL